MPFMNTDLNYFINPVFSLLDGNESQFEYKSKTS
jgi:hypothetical protein